MIGAHLSGLTRRRFFGAAIAAVSAAMAISPALAAPERLGFSGLYKSFGVRGLEFSDRVRALAGSEIALDGYMAPPLKAESNFFVLTAEPMALCPFCQSDADWPVDIVVVYLRRTVSLSDAGARIGVQGRLEIGSWTDPESGFVSQLRIVDARYAAR